MKNKVVIGVLIVLILLIIGFVIGFSSYFNKYYNISKTIDNDIKLKEEEIKLSNDELDKVKKDNELKYKNIENMNTYIDSLEKRVKEYE